MQERMVNVQGLTVGRDTYLPVRKLQFNIVRKGEYEDKYDI